MNARLLLTAGALSLGLGLTSAATAQQMPSSPDGSMGAMQPQGQMGQGQMNEDDAMQRPAKRPAKKMKTSTKKQKMAHHRQRKQPAGDGSGGAPAEGM